jgi:preprotein translocase subunit SecE
MTEQTDKTAAGGALDWLWVVAALALVVGGLVAYYTLTAQPTAVRAVAVIAGLALGVGAFAMSVPGRQAWQFALGSRVELRKMVWPETKDAWRMTLVVMVFVGVAGLFFWVVDWVLAWATRHLLGTGG